MGISFGLIMAVATPASAAQVSRFKALGADAFFNLYDEGAGVYTAVPSQFCRWDFSVRLGPAVKNGISPASSSTNGAMLTTNTRRSGTSIAIADPLTGSKLVDRNLMSASPRRFRPSGLTVGLFHRNGDACGR